MSDDVTRDSVTGEHLKDWGHRPGKQFPDLLARANDMRAQGFGLTLMNVMIALYGYKEPTLVRFERLSQAIFKRLSPAHQE